MPVRTADLKITDRENLLPPTCAVSQVEINLVVSHLLPHPGIELGREKKIVEETE
jgi:hypothetical protein